MGVSASVGLRCISDCVVLASVGLGDGGSANVADFGILFWWMLSNFGGFCGWGLDRGGGF